MLSRFTRGGGSRNVIGVMYVYVVGVVYVVGTCYLLREQSKDLLAGNVVTTTAQWDIDIGADTKTLHKEIGLKAGLNGLRFNILFHTTLDKMVIHPLSGKLFSIWWVLHAVRGRNTTLPPAPAGCICARHGE